MKKLFCVMASILGASLLISGCTPSRLEMDYGTSFKLAKFNQTLDPAAEKNLSPVYGLDSEAAQKVMEKYRKDFEKVAPEQKVYTIQVGDMQ